VRVTDHQLHPFQASSNQTAQEGRPEGFFLAGTEVDDQDLAFPRISHADGQHYCHVDGAMVLPPLQARRVQPEVGIGHLQRAIAKSRHRFRGLCPADSSSDVNASSQFEYAFLLLPAKVAITLQLSLQWRRGTPDAAA
jgi:hypothetical protein